MLVILEERLAEVATTHHLIKPARPVGGEGSAPRRGNGQRTGTVNGENPFPWLLVDSVCVFQ